MQNERDTVFELFEPPPGGVERMRARLAAPLRPRMGVALAAFGVAALAALVVAALLPEGAQAPAGGGNAVFAAPELDRLLGRESRPLPLQVERDGQAVETEELPSSDPNVRIYRVL
jgi:hypothetical protein